MSRMQRIERCCSSGRPHFHDLNILVNNAGIQHQIDFLAGTKDLLDGENEIETNLQATIHLSALFIPHLMKNWKLLL